MLILKKNQLKYKLRPKKNLKIKNIRLFKIVKLILSSMYIKAEMKIFKNIFFGFIIYKISRNNFIIFLIKNK